MSWATTHRVSMNRNSKEKGNQVNEGIFFPKQATLAENIRMESKKNESVMNEMAWNNFYVFCHIPLLPIFVIVLGWDWNIIVIALIHLNVFSAQQKLTSASGIKEQGKSAVMPSYYYQEVDKKFLFTFFLARGKGKIRDFLVLTCMLTTKRDFNQKNT